MKQHITVEQLNELSEKGKKGLRKWWEPKEGDKFLNYAGEVFYGEGYGPDDNTYSPDKVYFAGTAGEGKEEDLPLLSIGQLIEFLRESSNFGTLGVLTANSWVVNHNLPLTKSFKAKELCDALWEACREVLEK